MVCQLTTAEKTHLNRVMRCGLHIIYGDTYRSFTDAITRAGILSVTEQLQNMKTRFANKSARHSKFRKWFKVRPDDQMDTRRVKSKYLPVASRTARYAASPLPLLTSIINGGTYFNHVICKLSLLLVLICCTVSCSHASLVQYLRDHKALQLINHSLSLLGHINT